MKLKSHIFLLILVLLLLALGFWILTEFKTEEETGRSEQYRELVGNFTFPPIKASGNSYEVIQGEVYAGGTRVNDPVAQEEALSIAYYSLMARLDPILGLSGANLPQLERALLVLDEQQKEIASIFEGKQSTLVANTLYPISFLRALQVAEEARRELASKPSNARVKEYHEALRMTLTRYLAYLKQTQQVMAHISKEEAKVIHFIEGSTDPRTVQAALTSIERLLKETIARHDDRFHCFKGEPSRCEHPARVLERFLRSQGDAHRNTAVRAHEALWKDLSRNVTRALAASHPQLQGVTFGPIVLLNRESACSGLDPVSYQTAWIERKDGDRLFQIHDTDTAYAYELNRGENNYFEKLQESGVAYLFQPITNAYFCPSVYRDALFTRTTIALSPKGESATSLDASTVKNEVLQVAEELLLTARREAEGVPLPASLEKERVFLLYRDRSAGFEEFAYEAWRLNSRVAALKNLGTTMDLTALFLSRNYIPFFLFFHNETLFSESPIWMYQEKPNLEKFRLVPLKEVGSPAEIEKGVLEGLKASIHLLNEAE